MKIIITREDGEILEQFRVIPARHSFIVYDPQNEIAAAREIREGIELEWEVEEIE